MDVQVDYDSPVDQAWYLIFLHSGLGGKTPTTERRCLNVYGKGAPRATLTRRGETAIVGRYWHPMPQSTLLPYLMSLLTP